MNHPSPKQLSDYTVGKLPESALEVVARHLDDCPECQTTIANLAVTEDTFLGKVKTVRSAAAAEDPTGVAGRAAEPILASDRRGDGAAPSVGADATQAKVGKAPHSATASQPSGAANSERVPRPSVSPSSTAQTSGAGQSKNTGQPTESAAQPAGVGLTEFGKALEELELSTSAELATVVARLPADKRTDPQAVARLLVDDRKLTKFQAQITLAGKAKALRFGDYIVLDRIGAGGMGHVYRARHRRMDRIVALKVISSAALKSADSVERFKREVKAAAKLMHPNIVTAFDAGDHEGAHYLVMEFVDGPDLATRLKQGKFTEKQAVDCLLQAARGLAFAHAKGVVHRDIKPGNLLVDDEGVVKILDMGLARFDDPSAAADAQAEAGLTQHGQVMGTIDYMAPEQALNTSQATGKSDVYSLGCTLYRLLTGENAYGGTSIVEKILAHREKPIPSIRKLRPDISPALDMLFARLVAKRPDQRLSMQEAVEAFEAISKGSVLPGGDAFHSPFNQPQPPVPTAPSHGYSIYDEPAARGPEVPAPPMAPPLMALSVPQAVGIPSQPTLVQSQPGPPRAESRGRQPALRASQKPPRRNSGPLIALAAAAGAAAIAFGVWLYIKDKDGKTKLATELNPGDTITVGPDPAGTVPAIPAPTGSATPTASPLPTAAQPTVALNTVSPSLVPPSSSVQPNAAGPVDLRTAQAEWADFHQVPVEMTDINGGQYVLVPPGDFVMGTTPEQLEQIKAMNLAINPTFDNQTFAAAITKSEMPAHRMKWHNAYYISRTEVTVGQFKKFVEATNAKTSSDRNGGVQVYDQAAKKYVLDPNRNWRNPGYPVTDDMPVTYVTVFDATSYCQWLINEAKKQDRMGRLSVFSVPNEIQWEFACRAGTPTIFWFGDDYRQLRTNEWTSLDGGQGPNPVGKKQPNAFGLYDMLGNVKEWCGDSPRLYTSAGDGMAERPDPEIRAVRGGTWQQSISRTADRSQYPIQHSSGTLGFRVACTIAVGGNKPVAPPRVLSIPAPTTVPSTPVTSTPVPDTSPKPVVGNRPPSLAAAATPESWPSSKTRLEVAISNTCDFRAIPTEQLLRMTSAPDHYVGSTSLVHVHQRGSPSPANGRLDFRIEREGWYYLAANLTTTDDGKFDAALSAERLDTAGIARLGWTIFAQVSMWSPHNSTEFPPEVIYRSVFARYCLPGERFSVRTRKYDPPVLIIPGPQTRIADILLKLRPSAAPAPGAPSLSSSGPDVRPNGVFVPGTFDCARQTIRSSVGLSFDPTKDWLLMFDMRVPAVGDQPQTVLHLGKSKSSGDPLALSVTPQGKLRLDVPNLVEGPDASPTEAVIGARDRWINVVVRYRAEHRQITYGIDRQDRFGRGLSAPPDFVTPMSMTYGGEPLGTKRYLGQVRSIWFGNRPAPAGTGGIVVADLPTMSPIGATPASVTPASPPAPRRQADLAAERRAAESVLKIGGQISISTPSSSTPIVVKDAAALPAGPFVVTSVTLNRTEAKDADLEPLAGLSAVTSIGLYHTFISNTGLAHLRGLTSLTNLGANGGTMSYNDEGLKNLEGLTRLTKLDLTGSKVTLAGVTALHAKLPNCRILAKQGVFEPSSGAATPAAGAQPVAGPGLMPAGPLTERTIAERFLAAGAVLSVVGAGDTEKEVRAAAQLPSGELKITAIELTAASTFCDSDLEAVGTLKRLKRLIIHRAPLTGSGLRFLADMPELFFVSFFQCPSLGDSEFEYLAQLPKLQVVGFVSSQVGDEGMRKLSQTISPTFQSLNIDHTQVTDAGLAHVKNLKSLTFVNLDSTAVTDAGVESLAELPKLGTLILAYTKITDGCVSRLAAMKQLRDLNLKYTSLSPAAVARLQRELPAAKINFIPAAPGVQAPPSSGTGSVTLSPRGIAERVAMAGGTVKVVDAGGVETTAKSVAQLPSKNFDVVDIFLLDGESFTDGDLAAIGSLKKLRRLEISNSQITGTGLVHLKDMPELAYVGLGRGVLGDDGMEHVAALPALAVVAFVECKFGDVGLKKLAAAKTLEWLNVRDTRVTDAGMQSVKDLKGLSFVCLDGTAITDSTVEMLADFPKLTRLLLKRTAITDRSLAHLSRMKQLRDLDVSNSQLSKGAVDQLRTQLPGAKITY